jgi:HEPN domain-containing protein
MSVEKRVRAFFQVIEEDMQAAELLANAGNRLAAYHVQQAVEKLARALLLQLGVEVGPQHNVAVLLDQLPAESEWRVRLEKLARYSAFATAFRYPTSGGRLPDAPTKDTLLVDLQTLREDVRLARGELLPKP